MAKFDTGFDFSKTLAIHYLLTSTRKPNTMKKVWLEHIKEQKVQLFRIGIIQSETTLIFGSIVNTNLDSGNVLKELKKVYASIGITDKTFIKP
jgi:hypothetical protein